MYRGKLFAVGGNPENFTASQKTMWLLHLASKGQHNYHNHHNLTQAEAYDLLEKYRKGSLKAVKSHREIADSAMGEAYFSSLIQKATIAANQAGITWHKKRRAVSFHIYDPETDQEIPVYGRLGDAYIRRSGHSAFTDWLRRSIPEMVDKSRIIIPHDYMFSYEFELLQACEQEALRVLRNGGITGLDLIEQPC
jgi:hypothetical protein